MILILINIKLFQNKNYKLLNLRIKNINSSNNFLNHWKLKNKFIFE